MAQQVDYIEVRLVARNHLYEPREMINLATRLHNKGIGDIILIDNKPHVHKEYIQKLLKRFTRKYTKGQLSNMRMRLAMEIA